jgi:hypothetical protein
MSPNNLSDDYLVVYEGIIMRFGAIKEWIHMKEMDFADIRPANYEEIVEYTHVNKRYTE